MSSYLKFYELERSPFDDPAQPQVVLGTKALRDAFVAIQSGLAEGAARIALSGRSGMGKTSLARALPKLLADDASVAIVLDPSVPWDSVRGTIARQWDLAEGGLPRARLVEAARERRLVLVVDQAEKATTEFLDHLDVVLCYRSERDQPVVQSVLLADLSTPAEGEPTPLIWWLDRIHTLQVEFAPLPRDGVAPYVEKHLKRAGWRGGCLFTPEAAHAIHEFTGGIPGEVGRLCERLLAEAADRDLHQIDADFVHALAESPEFVGAGIARDISEQWVVDLDDDAPVEPSDDGFGPDAERSGAMPPTAERPPGAWGEDERFATRESPPESAFASPVARDLEADGETDDYTDDPLEAYLSRPATAAELRALVGGGFGGYARTVLAVAVGVILLGIAIAFLTSGSDDSEAPSTLVPQTAPTMAAPAPLVAPSGGSGLPEETRAAADAPAPVLARMRGPVLVDDAGNAGQAERAESKGNTARAALDRPDHRDPTTPGVQESTDRGR